MAGMRQGGDLARASIPRLRSAFQTNWRRAQVGSGESGKRSRSLSRSLARSFTSISLNTHSWGYRAPPLRPGRNVTKQMEIWCGLNGTRLSKYCITQSFYPARCQGLLMHSPILSSLCALPDPVESVSCMEIWLRPQFNHILEHRLW